MEAISYLLFQGLAGNPSAFADLAIDFLLADQRRLDVGDSDPYDSNGQNWATRELLEAITPEASEATFQRLEGALLDHYPPWELSKEGYRQRGMAQFTLLGGIEEGRRSEAVKKRFAEWQRKFNLEDGPPPVGRKGAFVTPIDRDDAEKMSDHNWLAAIETYADDDLREVRRGGAPRLAEVLKSEARAAPIRFARLAEKIPDEANAAYFDAIMRGVGASEAEIPLAVAAELVQRCHRLPGRPCGQSIALPLRRYAEAGLPDELLEIVGWYAVEGSAESDFQLLGESPGQWEREMRGLKSVRGEKAREIAHLVAANGENVAVLRPAIESLLADPDPSVRQIAMEIPVSELRHDEPQALEWFLRGVSDADDVVLDSRGAQVFLRYRSRRYFEILKPVIERMVDSADPGVRSAGAVQAALVALEETEATALLERCLAGGSQLRLGIARVFTANISSATHRALCEEHLIRLFDDPEADVRTAAAEALRELSGGDFADVESLVRGFLASRAFADDPEPIFAIVRSLVVPVEFAMEIAEALIAKLEGPSDDSSDGSFIAGAVNALLMGVYTDAPNSGLKNRALDLLDAALRSDSYGAGYQFASFDRG